MSFKTFLRRRVNALLSSKLISDKAAIKTKYKICFKHKLDLNNPKTFNEKLNWMKLYYRKPELPNMVDKYEVKNIVSSIIGDEYVIPALGIFDKWEDIDFNKFEAPFVLKTTHASGVVFVIKDKAAVDWKKIEKKIKKSLKINYFYSNREWPYKDCKRRILIEKFVKDSKEENLPVFKFFCFGGEPYIVQTIKNDKTTYETIDYFDMDWNRLDLKQNFENSEVPLSKPHNFEEMKKVAAKLSQGRPFIRVDLYSVDGKVYFSEFTLFSDAGYARFYPDSWDLKLGEKIILDNGTAN